MFKVMPNYRRSHRESQRPSIQRKPACQGTNRENEPMRTAVSWTEVLGSERLTGATLDRLTHRCAIIETKGESYRLADAKGRSRRTRSTAPAPATATPEVASVEPGPVDEAPVSE